MSQKQIKRINALLANSMQADNKDTADAYYEKAMELMAKYGIDSLADISVGDSIVRGNYVLSSDTPKSSYVLLDYLSQGLGGTKVFFVDELSDSFRVVIVGSQASIDALVSLFGVLAQQSAREYSWWSVSAGKEQNLKDDFICGFARGIKNRLTSRRTKYDRSGEGSGSELVLVKTAEDAIEKFVQQEFNEIQSIKTKQSIGYETELAARMAANRAVLDPTLDRDKSR